MLNRILLATDGSLHAENTIHFATNLAKALQAELIVMYAFDAVKPLRKRPSGLADEYRALLEEEAKETAQEIAERLREQKLRVNALAVEGSPGEAILRAIHTETPDLVVMGAREESGLSGLFVSSVAEYVVRHSPVPVLVVK